MRLPRSSATVILVLPFVLLIIYFGGVAVRLSQTIVIVRNDSGRPLKDVAISVQNRGKRYLTGDLAPQQIRRMFVRPVGESHINVEFKDAHGQIRVVTAIGYTEAGYCSAAMVKVLGSDEIETQDRTTNRACWRSWLDFFV